jgi:CRP/FNR family transcriptional regulator, cyclic AMP receptor protein
MIDENLLLAWGANYKKIKAGEFIFQEGDLCNFYHQLVEGRVCWVNADNYGKEFLQQLVDPGESFGDIPLFDEGNYVASARADEDSVIIRLHKPIFHELLVENPDLYLKFSSLMAKRLRFKWTLLKSLAFHEPCDRISTLLSYFKSENKNICSNCSQVKLTRQQIADMTGLRVETVIRTMRNMHDRGELLIEKGKVFC